MPNEYKKSYETLYAMIGFLGMILPVIDVWKCGWITPPSISESYYLGAIVPFTCILFSLGIIFFCNQGFDAIDTWANRISGAAAIGVVSFPCDGANPYPYIHYASAVVLFLTFAVMCIIFTDKRSNSSWGYKTMTETELKPTKKRRNSIYIVCSTSITLGLCAVALKLVSIYWGEVWMLESFGFAYMVQGKVFKFLNDK